MPHLIIQYSPQLDQTNNMSSLCNLLAAEIKKTGTFPQGGIRVRAYAADHVAIADGHPENQFAHMMLRIGAGRTDDEKHKAGDALMEAAKAFFAEQLDKPHFALSLEIVEIDKNFSWKTNTIHPRLKNRNTEKNDHI